MLSMLRSGFAFRPPAGVALQALGPARLYALQTAKSYEDMLMESIAQLWSQHVSKARQGIMQD